jgi:NAD(P)H-nitrite reductase large subunit
MQKCYKKEIETVVKKLSNCTVEEVVNVSKASTGCGRCRPLVKKLVETTKSKLPENNQLFIEF